MITLEPERKADRVPPKGDHVMKKLLMTTFAVGVILAGASADAFARQRSSTATGRNGGTVTRDFQSGCANGTCSRSRSVTGPQGNTHSHSGSATNNGDGTYSTQRSAEGRRGGTYSGSGTTDGNGTYSYSGTATGPNGQSVTKEKTVTVTPAP
jgi:hypothetical protein